MDERTAVWIPRAAVAALGFVLAGIAWMLLGGEAEQPAAAAGPRPAELPAVVREEPRVTGSVRAAIAAEHVVPLNPPAATGVLVTAAGTATPPAERWLRGRAFDLDGRPVGGLRVLAHVAGQTFEAVTADHGAFAMQVPAAAGRFDVAADTHLLVRTASWRREDLDVEQTLVVARAVELSGHVVDDLGRVVADAGLRVDVPREALARVPLPLDRTAARTFETTTDAAGAFALARAPHGPQAILTVAAPGHTTLSRPAPEGDHHGMILVVPRRQQDSLPADACVIHGRVVDVRGAGVIGATVRLRKDQTTTGEAGAFTLSVARGAPPATPLVAVHAGYQPAVIPAFGARLAAGDPGPVQLILPGEALAIAGQLVEPNGEPARGFMMRLLDGTVVDERSLPLLSAEDLVDGGSPHHRVAPDGGFRFTGLAAGRYRLRAWHVPSLRALQSEPIAAGDEQVRWVVPAARAEPITGLVRARDGEPLADVRVRACMNVEQSAGSRSCDCGADTVTDRDGRFLITGVARDGIFLRFTGAAVVGAEIDLGPEPEQEYVLMRRCHVRVTAAGADAFELHDEQDVLLSLQAISDGYSHGSTRVALEDGTSGVLATSEAAAWLVLFQDGREIARRPVRLEPGAVTTLGF